MRESCISHTARQPIAIVRQDYYFLTGRDAVAAAILNIFEYWANAEIAKNPSEVNPWVGIHTIQEFEELLVGIATDKQIRKRLHTLQEAGFIQVRQPLKHRKSLEFRFMVTVVQESLDRRPNGQTTADPTVKQPLTQRSNDRRPNGQTTADPTVKQPLTQRSNDRFTIYKEDQSEIKREVREKEFSYPEPEFGATAAQEAVPQSSTLLPTEPELQPTSNLVSTASLKTANTTADRVRRTWQETGLLPKIPMELEAWAQEDLGTEIIAFYRNSGRITTTKQGDIKPGFALYVAAQHESRTKDIDYGYSYIRSLEAVPHKWETLASLVIKWQSSVSTGDQNINITKEVNRTLKPPMQVSI
jgi:hypothetical protein